MTKADRKLIAAHTVVPHKRFGNEQAFSVYGGTLKRAQLVHAHPMNGDATIIKRAIAQDTREQHEPKATCPHGANPGPCYLC